MVGKFNSMKDEVVYRASLDQSYLSDQMGEVDGFGWYGLILDFHGRDYIVHEDAQGFVTVDSFATTYIGADDKPYRSAESGNAWVDVYDAYLTYCAEEDEEDEPDSFYESADVKFGYVRLG